VVKNEGRGGGWRVAGGIIIKVSGERYSLITRTFIGRLVTGVTQSRYLAWIKRQREFQPKILILKDGETKVFWVGQPTAEHIVLYFHGIIFEYCSRALANLVRRRLEYACQLWPLRICCCHIEKSRNEGKVPQLRVPTIRPRT
jgi:hypothetical protein